MHTLIVLPMKQWIERHNGVSGLLLYSSVVGCASGIAYRSFFVLETGTFLVGMVLAWGVVIFGVFLADAHARALVILAGIFLCAACIGGWRFDAVADRFEREVMLLSELETQEVTITGMVVRDPDVRETATYVVVETDSIEGSPHTAMVRVSIDRGTPITYGDAVVVRGVLARPAAFTGDLGRTFHYEEYLRASGITHTLSFADIAIHERSKGVWVLERLFALKHRFAEALALLLPEPQAGLALGLLLGEKHGLGDRLSEVFRNVGLIHIVVLSGYNLSIVAESIMRVLGHVRPRLRFMLGALTIIAFAVMVGLSATVLRASLMALLVLYARATGRTYTALRALALAGLVMLLIHPYVLLYDPGFQFSFLATFGLIVLSPLIERLCRYAPTQFGVREYMVSTIATQIMVTPLLLWSIGTMSVIAVVANLAVLVVVPLAMLGGFIAGIAGMLIGSAALIIAFPAYFLLSYMIKAAEFLSALPFAYFTVEQFPFVFVILAYLLLAGILFSVHPTPLSRDALR